MAQDRRSARYWLRLVGFLIILVGAAVFLIPTGIGFLFTFSLTRTPCVSTGTPASYALEFEDVQFPSGDATIPAYFIPGTTDAAVIVAPPLNHDRGGQMNYAAMFNELGLNVLTIGARTCAGIPGSLGYYEGDDVGAAYAYLAARDGVNPDRISVHGFSAAGAAALFGAARTPEIRAVSAMGNYQDMRLTIGDPQDAGSFMDALLRQGTIWGYEVGAGVTIDRLRPIEALAEIPPRPVLLVYGENELQAQSIDVFLAATDGQAEVWIAPGVAHGGYLAAHPQEASERIGGFHVNALLGDG